MDMTAERESVLESARAIVDGAKSAGRDLTSDEISKLNESVEKVKGLDARANQVTMAAKAVAALGELPTNGGGKYREADEDAPAKSWGEHFVKHAGAAFKASRGVSGATVSAPEIKAATDVQVTGNSVYNPIVTQLDRTIIPVYRPRLVLADLFGTGSISGTGISYFLEGAFEGAFAMVAEGGQKPQVHVADPTVVTDVTRKIAGFIKFTDEMLEDLDFIVTEINNRLPYELDKTVEAQLLSGNGTGQNLLGVLNRSGIQTEARGNGASGDTVADTIFRAMTKVSTGSGLDADGIVMHPLDYQALRLSKDGNGQYFGGGYFQGPYGNGGIQENPPVWGLRTVVTPSVAQGTVLVGAFKQAVTVYYKGGVRIESTNSHATDFTTNLVTTRVERRLALAVRRPSAIVKTTITPAA